MRKKKFAGLLMLTAAVALGTVSPAALPNTVEIVKANTDYSFKADEAANYETLTLEVMNDGKLKVKKDDFDTNLTGDGKEHIWGFGETASKAIEDAINHKEDEKRKITIAEKAFEVEVPNNAKFLAIVKVASIASPSTEVIGGKVELTPLRNTLAETTDYKASTVTQGKANAVTAIKYRLKDGSDSAWLDAVAGNDFPTQAVEEGKTATYEIKKTFVAGEISSVGKLESEIKEFKIIHNETKQAEDNKQSDSTSTTETKQLERVSAKNTKNNTVKVSEEKIAEALETGLKVMAKSGEVKFSAKAIEKMVGNSAEAVTVTLKTTATKSNAKEVTKNLKGSKLVSKKVFTLNIKAGNMTVKESQLSGTKINVTLKVNLKKAPMFVWVMDLSTGKKVKAAYKNGNLTFKTSNLGKFVIVNQ